MEENRKSFHWHKTVETSAADLLRECGEKLTDRALWTEFQGRFQRRIFLYLMRALRLRRIQDDTCDVVPDLAQEVYLKLVQHDGRILRSFRGTTEFSVMAFLAKVADTVVRDFRRRGATEKRRAQVVSIDVVKAAEFEGKRLPESQEFGPGDLSAI